MGISSQRVGLAALLVVTSPFCGDDGTGLLERAAALYRSMHPAEAVRLYRQYLGSYPDRPDVRVFMGAALLNLGRQEEALEEARRALAIDPQYARSHILIGRIYTARQEWAAAEKAFKLGLSVDPKDREGWYFLGRCYYEENLFEKARDAFLRAINLKAEHSRNYENLALTYEAMMEYEEAEKAHRRAVELAGDEYRPYFAYGVFLYKQGRDQESLAMLQKAVNAGPNAAEARFEFGKVLLHLGRLHEAARETEAALSLSGECRFRPQLVRIYLRQERTEEADEQAKKIRACESR